MATISLEQVTKIYPNDFEAIHELDLELAEGTVVADTVGDMPCVFLGGLYRAELVTAERLRRLANGTPPWPSIDPGKALPWIERKTGLALAQSQAAAILEIERSTLDRKIKGYDLKR